MLAVLRQRNFALVWVAGLISLTGDWLLFVALPLTVYQLTGSTAATAAMVASRVLPRLLFGSVAGVFVDRWDRRRTMLATNLLLGGCLLPLLFVRAADWLWLIYVVSFLNSALAQFLHPAENALLPRLVAEEDLIPANALNGLNDNLARLVGPPLGGLIVAGGGLTGAVLLDAASFFVAAGLVALVAVDGRAARANGNETAPRIGPTGAWVAVWREWLTGLALMRRSRPVAVLGLFRATSNIGEGFFAALLVPFVATVLGGGEVAFGALVAAQAVGGLIGSVAIGHIGRGVPPWRLLGLGAIGLGAIDLCTINAHRLVPGVLLPIIFMVIVGLPESGLGVGFTTLLQTSVADEYRGRVFGGINAVGAVSMLIGTALAGALADRLGVVSMLNAEGVIFILAGAMVLFALAPTTAGIAARARAEAETN